MMQTSITLRRYALLYFVILVLTAGLTSGRHVVAQATPAAPDFATQTPMMLGSVSKSFTTLDVMPLVEQDKVELDAPVERYLPWFRLAAPNWHPAAAAQLTVSHPLNQTSGFTEHREYGVFSRSDWRLQSLRLNS